MNSFCAGSPLSIHSLFLIYSLLISEASSPKFLYVCMYLAACLEWLLNLTKKKKKSLLERNDKGQGKIFDRFFFKKKNLVGCLE